MAEIAAAINFLMECVKPIRKKHVSGSETGDVPCNRGCRRHKRGWGETLRCEKRSRSLAAKAARDHRS